MKVCIQRNQNKTLPLNGIMCGSQGSVPQRTGYCQSNERCTGTTDINQGVDFNDKQQLCSLANICYCEHPNERAPLNGILCGDPTNGHIFQRTNYCGWRQRCAGPSDVSQGIDANLKFQLCENVYSKRTNTRCWNKMRYYKSLSEAKSECEKQPKCTMVEESFYRNGWSDEKSWIVSKGPTWIASIATCEGYSYDGTPYKAYGSWKTGTIWLKDSAPCKMEWYEYGKYGYNGCQDCRYDEECPPSKNAGCRNNVCEECPSECQKCRNLRLTVCKGPCCKWPAKNNDDCTRDARRNPEYAEKEYVDTGEIGCANYCVGLSWFDTQSSHHYVKNACGDKDGVDATSRNTYDCRNCVHLK